MQLLRYGMQKLLQAGETPPNGKTASERLTDRHELLPMRFARGRAGIRRRTVWSAALTRSGRNPLPVIPSPGAPDGYRNRDPRRDSLKARGGVAFALELCLRVRPFVGLLLGLRFRHSIPLFNSSD